MKKLYKFEYPQEYSKYLSIFIADEKDVETILNYNDEIYLGEVDGKHGDVYWDPSRESRYLKTISDKSEDLEYFKKLFGNDSIGYNFIEDCFKTINFNN